MPSGTHLDVRRFQIPMDDPLLVRGFQCLGDLLGDGQGFINRNRSLREAIREGRSLDQLHHQSAVAVALFETVNVAMFG